jgi:excisionase family DNA binding protein
MMGGATNGLSITRTTPIAELPEFLRPDELADYLDVGRSAVYELLRRGEIASVRCGRLLRIPKSAIAAMSACR